MRNRTDKEQAEYLRNKLELKRKNGVDCTKEICEALEFILSHADSKECDLEEYTKEFMKMHSIILPEDKDKRLEILINNVEKVLPLLTLENPKLNESVKDMYITLDAISNEICTPAEDDCYSIDLLPEDEFIEEIGDLFLVKEGNPEEEYYVLTMKYVSLLINRLKQAIQTDDIKTMKAVGIRLDLQSLQYEQLYRYHLVKE